MSGQLGRQVDKLAAADILDNVKFDVGYGMLPYRPDLAGAPQNTIVGGATLWVLRDRPREEYSGVAKFFAFLSCGWDRSC